MTLPLGMQLQHGTRLIVDQEPAGDRAVLSCASPNGCMADYEANADLIGQLKKGQHADRAGDQHERPADQPAAAAQRFRQGL